MELWNKRKITIAECGSVWDSGTVLVCKKGDAWDGKRQLAFIHGASGDYGVKVGDVRMCHHDQTGAFKGEYEIINIVHWKKVDDKVVLESVLPYDANTKASLAVFK
jgi:hypothetical protein